MQMCVCLKEHKQHMKESTVLGSLHGLIIIIIHAFIKRRNPTCRSKALNNDIAKVTRTANSKIR